LFLFPLILVCTATRKQKQFSLFSIVSFKQESCSAVSTSGVKGVCMTSSECNNMSGGTADGNCAASFGVCCVISISTCGSTISQNCSYIENPSYPSAYSTTGDCSYTVSRCQDDICQIRLDFFAASLQQPSTTASGGTAPACTDTYLDISAGTTSESFVSDPPSNLCGTLTGQHIYIDSGRASTAATLKFTLGSAESNTWKIKVTQIECWNPSKAPEGCMQYFYGDFRHTVTSMNWDGTSTCSTGCNLGDQQYTVCFRPEQGMCAMQIQPTKVSSSLDAFKLGADTTGMVHLDVCDEEYAYLIINNLNHETGDTFCGEHFNTEVSTTSDGTVQTGGSNPFQFIVAAEEDVEATAGFSLDVQQIACGNSLLGPRTIEP